MINYNTYHLVGRISAINSPTMISMRIFKLMEKGSDSGSQRFTLFKILRGHELPLTSCIFSKAGSKIITGAQGKGRMQLMLMSKQLPNKKSTKCACCYFPQLTTELTAFYFPLY